MGSGNNNIIEFAKIGQYGGECQDFSSEVTKGTPCFVTRMREARKLKSHTRHLGHHRYFISVIQAIRQIIGEDRSNNFKSIS